MTLPSAQDVFDVRKIRRLVELMKEHDLSEIDLQQGDVRIQLRRGWSAQTPPPTVPVAAPLAPLAPLTPPLGQATSSDESLSTPSKENIAYIKARW